jgi:CheY-like chemotaxis protein
MATKVLVFESDSAFAGELRSEFGRLGCSTTVVDDGNVGLQQAAMERPDLILLAIELPRMNGFSVCNKLKKDPNLKDVPLIIMSTESSDETFEQHKKLRTRAEDYVHKPIAFGELLQHIQGFVHLPPYAADSDTAIVIDDEIEVGSTDYLGDDNAGEPSGEIPIPEATGRRIESVDSDVDAFAESAFGRLTGPDAVAPEPQGRLLHNNGAPAMDAAPSMAQRLSAPPGSTRSQSAQPSAAPVGVDPVEYERVRDELIRVKERFDEVDRAFEDARDELERLRIEAAESERRGREIEELRSKVASGTKGAAISSREFLDLREALNKKDKELLTLKEQIAKKDRQIIEAQDRSLASERARSDLDDRLLSMERELGETKERNESLAADRDLAKKASEDFRTRLEKLRADNEGKERQLADLRARHEGELAAAEDRFAAMRAELDQTLANERAEHARALDQSEERRKRDVDQARRDYEAQLTGARGEWEAELARARADADRHEQTALDELRLALQAKATREIEEVNERAAKLGHDLAVSREEAEELRLAKGELEAKRALDDARIASLEAECAGAQRDLAEVKQRLAVETMRADSAQAKWQADRQSLERAKDALALALAQIEEVEARP